MRGKNFKVLGFLFVLGMIFVSMNFVSATLTLNTPAVSANISGTTYLLNATLDINNGSYTNLTRAWFYAMYANGTNITIASFVENVTNIGWNTTWNTNGVIDANASFTFWAFVARGNGTVSDGNQSDSSLTVTVDNSAPTVFLLSYANGTLSNNTNLTINISFIDTPLTSTSPCIVNVNGTNQTLTSTAVNSTYRTCNTTTLSLKSMNDGNATINIYVNNSAGLVGLLASSVVFIDSNGPTVELSATTITKDTITLAISATDAGTGVSSCTVDRAGATVSGTTSLTESGLSCAASYTYVVTCSDANGHSADATATFATNGCGGGTASGGTSKPAVNTFTQITPGAASIVKYTDSTLAVKQVEITVNSEAQNVKVTVTKYAGKPAEVSVSKTGKVYQYVQIDAQNVEGKLDKANVQFKVEKSWASSNSVDKSKISVYKFDETSSKWNELTTTYASEDDTHYYYDVSLDSFSYFAVSERSLVPGEGTTATGEEVTEDGGGRSLTWLWILIVLVIVVLVWMAVRKKSSA